MDHQELESGAGGGQGRGSAARIDMQGRVPLYHQIFLTLKNRIYSGMLGPGDPVPGEQELCGEFGVSRITAKRALNELADAGLVVRERGRGTRVVPHPPAQAWDAILQLHAETGCSGGHLVQPREGSDVGALIEQQEEARVDRLAERAVVHAHGPGRCRRHRRRSFWLSRR